MVEVSKIGWTWHTAAAPGSGTDARVTIRVRRDGQQLAYVSEESGETERLDRGSRYESWWTFVNPTGIGTAVSGKTVPYTEQFPQGVAGHLTVELEIHGDDKWSWEYIGVHVVEGKKAFIPGTIDGWVWAESATTYHFQYDRSMSTDSGEGYRRITLKI